VFWLLKLLLDQNLVVINFKFNNNFSKTRRLCSSNTHDGTACFTTLLKLGSIWPCGFKVA